MAAKPATLAAVAKLTKQSADLDAQRKKIAKRLETVKTIGNDAIKKNDYSRLGVVLKALAGDINAISASISTGKECVATLETVKEDEEFVSERLEAIDKLAQKIDDARDAIGESFETAKDLQNDVEAKMKELGSEQANLRIKMAGMEKDVKNLVQRIDAADKSAAAIWPKAVAAHEGRDAKTLKAEGDRYGSLGAADLQTELNDMTAEIASLKKVAANVDAKLKAFMLDAMKDVAPSLEAAQGKLDTMKANLARLQKDMTVDAVDPKKALSLLELDAKWLAKLTKALASPAADLERALGALAKEAKLETTGKQMADALKKAKLL